MASAQALVKAVAGGAWRSCGGQAIVLAAWRTLRGPEDDAVALVERHLSGYDRMLTARAATRRMVIAESVDSAAINVLAGRVSGMESVGLKAIEFVSET
jgi:hypothetical protein